MPRRLTPKLWAGCRVSRPPNDRIIGYPASDYFSFPKLRWTFCHFREIQATKRVGRGLGPVSPFEEALDPAIEDVTFTPIGAERR
jgi:hypothetical protein